MATPFTLADLLKLGAIFASIKNRLFNKIASTMVGSRVAIDWRCIKIVRPKNIVIGQNFSAGHSLWLECVGENGRLIIGNNVNFSDSVHIGCANSVTIGDEVLIGSRVLITDHSHGRTSDLLGQQAPNARAIYSKGPVSIGRAVWIGDGTALLAGVTVGDSAIIGANSVVLQDVPAATVWAGTPARQVWPRADVTV